MRTFYHADRGLRMGPNQTLELNDGLSVFGQSYWFKIANQPPRLDCPDSVREYELETLRRERFGNLPGSRMTALFAAPSVETAIRFARSIAPHPGHAIPVFEVSSARAECLDSVWLDYDASREIRREYYAAYWRGEVSNHRPVQGCRREPDFEVLLQHPIFVGAQVATALPLI